MSICIPTQSCIHTHKKTHQLTFEEFHGDVHADGILHHATVDDGSLDDSPVDSTKAAFSEWPFISDEDASAR